MSNLDLVWDNANGRADWQVSGGRLSTGNLLRTAVWISLFTDRYEPGTADPRGWWCDSLDRVLIGSRLRDLRRAKISNRAQLIAQATDIIREATQWMVDSGIVARIDIAVASAAAGIGSTGNLLTFVLGLTEPNGRATMLQALWSAV